MPEIRRFPSIPTKILLPIDFSPSSQAALDMAADLAQHFRAELYLVNVIPEFPTLQFQTSFQRPRFLRMQENTQRPTWPSARLPWQPER